MSLQHSSVCSALLSHITAQQQKTAEEEKEKSLLGDVRAAVFAQTGLLLMKLEQHMEYREKPNC